MLMTVVLRDWCFVPLVLLAVKLVGRAAENYIHSVTVALEVAVLKDP